MSAPPNVWYYPDMEAIPRFQLYGEGECLSDPGFVHIETIASRSRQNGWRIRPHSHDTLDQLLIVRSGSAHVHIDGLARVLAGPAVVYVPASAVHGFRFEDCVTGDVVTFSVELRASLALGQPGRIDLVDRALACETDATLLDRLVPLLDQLQLECSGHAQGRIAASAWIVGLLLLHVGRFAGDAAGASPGDARLIQFRRMVDRHFREHRPIAFYADGVNMTERSLTRLTRAKLGCAPARYLRQRLLLEARRHLAYGTQPIARIADQLGFADASYFTRFYRQMSGEVPSALRRPEDAPP